MTEFSNCNLTKEKDKKTYQNLLKAIAGESIARNKYTFYAEIADLFKEISEVEEKHAERYDILASRLEKGNLFQGDTEIEWECLNCGYIHKGTSAPEKCPLCQKPQGYYMALNAVR